MTLNDLMLTAQKLLADYGSKVLKALVVFLVGWVIIRIVLRLLRRGLSRSKSIDPTMHSFLLSLSRIAMIVVLVMICMDVLTIPITPLITALGAVGLAASLAVKDSLANLLGGALLLISKPFGVGDYCEIDGLAGTIAEIGLIYTFLNTSDNKRICIPNGQVGNARIVNYSAEDGRRLDLTFSIGYDADFDRARQIILEVVQRHPLARKGPSPLVRMSAHAASAIEITCRVWVDTAHYWDLNFDLLEQVKREFDSAGIAIPYPQMDIHVQH